MSVTDSTETGGATAPRIAGVGAGIAGLSCAYALTKGGAEV